MGHFLWLVEQDSSADLVDKYRRGGQDVTDWKKLLTVLDQEIGLPNKVISKVKVVQQGFDSRTQEHVVWLEYRCRVRNVPVPKPDPRLVKAYKDRKMSLLKDLLNHFAH